MNIAFRSFATPYQKTFIKPFITIVRFCNTRSRIFLLTSYSGSGKSQAEKQSLTRKGTYGDDAYFIVNGETSRFDVFGIADGVGGWKQYGVDPSLFSHFLMKNCERYVKDYCVNSASPKKILQAGYDNLISEHPDLLGSSTACVAVVDKNTRMLYSANLGDSGFLIIRDRSVIHQSKEQQHYFNAPYQLTCHITGQSYLGNRPSEADEFSILLKNNDIIIMATDGLFDNVTEKQILDIINSPNNHNAINLQKITNRLVDKALKLSEDRHYISPFARKARTHGIYTKGGKPDDVTIIVVCVQPYY